MLGEGTVLCFWNLSNMTSLTLGLMGLDELHLRVLATSSADEKEKENAKKGTRSPS